MSDEAEPLAVSAEANAAHCAPKMVCKVTGKVDSQGKIGLRLDQSPGALLAVFGSREPGAAPGSTAEPKPGFVDTTIVQLLSIALGAQKPPPGGDMPASAINAMLQMMQAFEPTNELEGAIAAQAAAIHHAMLDCLSRGMRSERHDCRQSHLGMANKCARTFAVLVEALNRHRGKTTTQRVIVENVNVNAGGQAVVGAVTGVGGKKNGGVQAHEFETEEGADRTGEGAFRPALPCPQSSGEALPAAGNEGMEALQPSRRSARQRRAQGKQEPVGARQPKRGCDRRAADAERDAAKRASTSGLNGANG